MQRAILQTLSELKSQGFDTQRALGRIEGTLESHGERLDRIEDRELSSKPQLRLRDFSAAIPGLVLVVLGILGTVPWSIVAQSLKP